jgi:uncharacterized protein (TIRG00374 family)
LKNKLVTILKFLFFLGLGVFLIWLAVRNKSEEELRNIRNSILQADYSWIILSLFISALSHYFRALRWKLLLQPMGHSPGTLNTFCAVMVGYLANCAVPRLGEVTRCGVLTRYEKVPFTQGFGSVIAERALDVICLLILFLLMLGLEFQSMYAIADKLIFSFVAAKWQGMMSNPGAPLIAVIVVLIVVIAIWLLRKRIKNLFSAKVKAFFNGLWEGLKSVTAVANPKRFILYTVLIWLMYVLQVFVVFFAFADTSELGFGVAVAITVFGSLGIAVVPGGTGAYQYIVILMLTSIYLVAEPAAFAYAWAVWSSQIVLILFLGLLSLLALPALNRDKF